MYLSTSMRGMMGSDDMDELANPSGAESDEKFLTMMAKTEQAEGEYPDAGLSPRRSRGRRPWRSRRCRSCSADARHVVS